MVRCQDLDEEALLDPNEAADAFAEGRRCVAALSYAWLTPGHPDPTAVNVQHLCAFLRGDTGANFVGLFWDFGSLPQKDDAGARTQPEALRFARGLRLMAILYASAQGSAVLRLTNVPERPPGHAGVWNDTPYLRRGWCVFESFCAMIQAGLENELEEDDDADGAPSDGAPRDGAPRDGVPRDGAPPPSLGRPSSGCDEAALGSLQRAAGARCASRSTRTSSTPSLFSKLSLGHFRLSSLSLPLAAALSPLTSLGAARSSESARSSASRDAHRSTDATSGALPAKLIDVLTGEVRRAR